METKLAAIMGAWVLSHEQYVPYYEKAMKIRRLIKQALCFEKYDVLALPLSCGHAVTALAGLPSISFSWNGCGVQLVANTKNENALLTAWEVLQS